MTIAEKDGRFYCDCQGNECNVGEVDERGVILLCSWCGDFYWLDTPVVREKYEMYVAGPFIARIRRKK